MRNAFYLAVRYLYGARGRSLVLVLGVAVALFLPLFTWRGADYLEARLLERARSSPILLGQAGNEVDLTLATLYFRGGVGGSVPYELGAAVDGSAVALHVGHSAAGRPVLGTDTDYFSVRSLEPAAGRLPVWIGETVAGAALARELRLEVGDTVRSDSSNLYNLSGAYPLLLEVVGILRPTGGPDDEIWITDIKTSWAMDGLFHGHDTVQAGPTTGTEPDIAASNRPGTGEEIEGRGESDGNGTGNPDEIDEADHVEASAALFLFSEITRSNRHTFHLHGEPGKAPVTAFLVHPSDRRAHDQILGDFAVDGLHQAVRPSRVVRSLLDIVLRLQDALQTYFALVALSTFCFFALVMVLGLRLRRRELALMARLGCDRGTLAQMIGAEIVLVLSAASLLALAASHGALQLLARWV